MSEQWSYRAVDYKTTGACNDGWYVAQFLDDEEADWICDVVHGEDACKIAATLNAAERRDAERKLLDKMADWVETIYIGSADGKGGE